MLIGLCLYSFPGSCRLGVLCVWFELFINCESARAPAAVSASVTESKTVNMNAADFFFDPKGSGEVPEVVDCGEGSGDQGHRRMAGGQV